MDQTEETQVKRLVSEIQPQVIINAAAMTDVDLCEVQSQTAFLVNATSVHHLAEAAKEIDSFLVQLSTDYVFDGEKGSYSEEDNPHPVDQYGLSKLKGEEAAQHLEEEQWCVARSSVIYGWGRLHRHNAATFVYSKLSRRERVSMVSDQYSSPTLNTNLAEMVVEIAERRVPGILHVAGASRVSRYDLAMGVASILELDTHLITSVSTRDMNWRAKRPQDSSLNIGKASRILSNRPLLIEQAFSRLLQEYNSLSPSERM